MCAIPAVLGKFTVRYLVESDYLAYYELEKDPEAKQFVGGPTRKSRESTLDRGSKEQSYGL